MQWTRRDFMKITGAGLALQGLTAHFPAGAASATMKGPGVSYVPKVSVAFVRRKGDYGLRWPGAVYDGEAALKDYRAKIEATAADLGMRADIRPEPVYSLEEAEGWLKEAEAKSADGVLVVLLDRQEHAWPTATKAVEGPLPAIIFAPIGAAFTTNTAPLAQKEGGFLCSTDDFNQPAFGLKMIHAGARLRETRFIVIKGNDRKEEILPHLGMKLQYLPAQDFVKTYTDMPEDEAVRALAREYMKNATRIEGTTEQDVRNGIKSFLVARELLQRENGDGISMDCLGALGPTKISLPCIAWSRMLDEGIPAACEADVGACVTHALVQYLFDRPGFEQDPVPDTGTNCLVAAHCTCPTRLSGFRQAPEPYHLSFHHGKRDAVPIPQWRVDQRVTVADIELPQDAKNPPSMIISTGTVVNNVSVPPSGGCVVSVRIKLDGVEDLLDYPGFHQVIFYGDYKKELRNFCRLYKIQATLV